MNLPAWADSIRLDLRYGMRTITTSPGVTAIAVLSLALGIGANTAIFSLIDTILLKLLPVPSPEELFVVARGGSGAPSVSWNYPDYEAFRDRNNSFTALAACGGSMPLGLQAEGAGGVTEVAYAAMVSGNYFEMLGVKPAMGRLFNAEYDHKPGDSPYVVISYDYWNAHFNRDPGVLGRNLRLNGYPFTIIGVSGAGFRGTDVTTSPNLFLPIMMRSQVTGVPYGIWNTRHFWWLQAIGRLKPGAAPGQAEPELTAVYRSQEEAERRNRQGGGFINSGQQISLLHAAGGYSYTRNRIQQLLTVLMAVVGLVLLIACANVANLMLARGAARQREISVRMAVGAGRLRIVQQLLAESILISFLGGMIGLAFAYVGVQVLLGFVPNSGMAQVNINVVPDWRLLSFASAISLLTGIAFGLFPALRSTRPDIVDTLKSDTPGSTGASRPALRNALVVVQVALCLVLLIGAALFVRSLTNLRDIDLGFRRDKAVIVTVDPSRNGYKGQRLREFYERLRAEVASVPGVRASSLAEITPLAGMRWNGDFSVEGYQWRDNDQKYVDMNAVSPGFFETMGIPIVRGRDFREEDNPAYSQDPPETPDPQGGLQALSGPRVIIITESMVRHFFESRNPIGLHISMGEEFDPAQAYEIIGVVRDAHYFGLREKVEPMIYFPQWRPGASSRALCILTGGDVPGIAETVRRIATGLDPGVPVLGVRTLEQQIDDNIVQERMITTLTSFFGLLALLLAGVGLYGVMSYSVTRRTREIGIRMALGARRATVLRLILHEAVRILVLGTAIGIPAALAVTRLAQSFLYGISPQDPATVIISTSVLALVLMVAGIIPALRATRVDPMISLRCE